MRPVHLLQLTDPHLYAEDAGEIYGVNTARSLQRVLEHLFDGDGPRADAIVVTGDIADDLSEGAYRRLRSALGRYGIPVYSLPGNHDDPILMARLLADDGFQYLGRAEIGGWGLVLADTHEPGRVGGRLSPEELQRLDADLEAFRDRPVVVGLHHPPVPVGSRWIDALGLVNAGEFLALVERHPQVKAVIAGHVHQAFDTMRGAVRVLTSPSTCAQFLPRTDDSVIDDRPPGYRWLTLHEDGTMRTEVRWLRD